MSFLKTNRGESWPWPASKFHNIYIKCCLCWCQKLILILAVPCCQVVPILELLLAMGSGYRPCLDAMTLHAATLISPHREQENQSIPGPGFKILLTLLLILFLLFEGVSRHTPRPDSGTYYSIYVLQTTDPRPWLWESTFHELFRL